MTEGTGSTGVMERGWEELPGIVVFLSSERPPDRCSPWKTAIAANRKGIRSGYRDNLALNVLMLIWPSKVIKSWQMGALP
jgi:hypothetical protein